MQRTFFSKAVEANCRSWLFNVERGLLTMFLIMTIISALAFCGEIAYAKLVAQRNMNDDKMTTKIVTFFKIQGVPKVR
jgi:hypothetical protein